MGLIKLELDIPEFKKELNINITIKSDGEVVYSTSPSPIVSRDNKPEEVISVASQSINDSNKIKNEKKTSKGGAFGGNMMNITM